jgi:hypothetical protein
MIKLQITSDNDNIVPIIKSAILARLKRIEIGLQKTKQEIKQFESKYQTSSEQFLKSYTAEDLKGGDDEYISWMGEIKLKESIIEELEALRNIEYVNQRLPI